MIERYVSALPSVRSGIMDCGVSGSAKPCVDPYQMPRQPMPTAMTTLRMAPEFMIHEMSPTSCMLVHTTNQMKAISMRISTQSGISKPRIPLMVVGKRTVIDASHVK